jgi:hypothetical protein
MLPQRPMEIKMALVLKLNYELLQYSTALGAANENIMLQ